MFRFGQSFSSSGGFAPLEDAPDAGTGGGGNDPVGGGDGLPPSDVITEPVVGEEPATARTTDDDDEDDDDEDLRPDAEVTPERVKRITAKLSKLKRRDRNFRVERGRLRELRAQGITLDDLIHGSRQHQALAAELARNPALKKLVSGDVADEKEARAAETTREEPAPDPDFDESALPFDPSENDTNRYFAGLAKSNHELMRTTKALQTRLDAIEGKDTARVQAEAQRAEATEKSTWKGAIDAAAKTIADEETRDLFKDAMTAAYERRKNHGRSPQQIIAHYLRGRLAPGQQKAANDAAAKAAKPAATTPATTPVRTAATQQRIAESNKNLPRTVGPVGTPATARTKKESLSDVRRRVTGTNSRY